MRRAEALYALVSAQAGETGVGGIDWANRRLAAAGRTIDFEMAASTDPAQERYLRQSLGVFGGAYYSQMVEMGLFTENRHGIQVATRDLGRRAATLFADAIGPDLVKLLRQKITDARVTPGDLERLEPIIPSAIAPDSAERLFYEAVLFAREEPARKSAHSRAATLALILDAASARGGWPDPEQVRWHMFDPPENALSPGLETQRPNWEAYQCQDLMQVACAALLAWAIAIINSAPHGQSLPEIRAEIVAHLAAQEEYLVSARSAYWRDIRCRIEPMTFAYQNAWRSLTSARGVVTDKAAEAINLMATLHQRIASRTDLATAVAQGLPDRGSAHSLRTEVGWLERREGEAVADLIADYMLERVVRRHSWVAMQKLRRQRDYTFLFEQRDARLVYLAAYQPVATTPRLQPAIQFLADIHLLGEDGPTPLGLAALEAMQ